MKKRKNNGGKEQKAIEKNAFKKEEPQIKKTDSRYCHFCDVVYFVFGGSGASYFLLFRSGVQKIRLFSFLDKKKIP
jgi:4-diphosphocytidyl-2C-methyl-D-erythritol kinase